MKHSILYLFIFLSLCSYGQHLTNFTPLNSYSQTDINLFLNSKGVDTTTTETNAVESFSIEYKTVNANGDTVIASGAVYLPVLEHCYSTSMLVYEHGTEFTKTSVPFYGGYSVRGKYFSGTGYITVMPDYIGLGISTEIQTYHHSKTEASASIDLIRACREFLLINGNIQDNKQLYLTGYSQGGHVAMATNKYIKDYNLESEFNVVANAPMSGAYNLSGVQRDLVFEDSTYSIPMFLPNIIIGYQSVYGNLYNNYSDVFDSPYDNTYETRVNAGTTSGFFWYLNTPANHYHFLQDTFVNNLLNDVTRNYHPMNLALKDNDLHNWVPQNPVRMLYCGNDNVVSPLNSVVALDTMLSLGATNVDAINIDPSGGHNSCFTPAVAYVSLWFDSLRTPCSIGSFSNVNVCDGDSIIHNGITYFNDTVISDTLLTANLTDSIVTLAINVIPSPVVQIITISSDTICENELVILNGQGANSYTWSHGLINGNSFLPQNDTTYLLTGTNSNGCEASDSISFKIVDYPLVSLSVTDSVICEGESITLSQTNNGSFGAWNNQYQENTPLLINNTTTFTYTAYNSSNCFTTSDLTVIVNSNPILQTNALDSNICIGDSINYWAFGTDSIYWNNGISNNTYFTPTVANYYQVVGISSENCRDSLGFNLTINSLPNVTANALTNNLCAGDYNRIFGNGAQTYTWDNNYNDNDYIQLTNSTLFTVEGTDANGCSAIDSIFITVNQLPSLFLAYNDTILCPNDSIQLLGLNNSFQYSWSNSITDGDYYTPTQAEYILATATDSHNCSHTDSINITISSTPSLVANASNNEVCIGDSIFISVNSNAQNIEWENGLINNSYYAPTTSHYITVNAYNNLNCLSSDSIFIEVQELPSPIITELNGVLSTLTYDSYQWVLNSMTISNANAQSYTPNSSGTYSVIVDSNFCTNTSTPFVYSATGIASSTLLDLSIYPNPAIDYLVLKNNLGLNQVFIINNLGQSIKIPVIDSVIDISNLAKGTYSLVVYINGETLAHKFIKL